MRKKSRCFEVVWVAHDPAIGMKTTRWARVFVDGGSFRAMRAVAKFYGVRHGILSCNEVDKQPTPLVLD